MDIREHIEKNENLKLVPFMVTEWKKKVYIKQLTPLEWDKLSRLEDDLKKKGHYVLSIPYIIFAVVDENGKHYFSEKDVPFLQERGMRALTQLVMKIGEVNTGSKKNLLTDQ